MEEELPPEKVVTGRNSGRASNSLTVLKMSMYALDENCSYYSHDLNYALRGLCIVLEMYMYIYAFLPQLGTNAQELI